MVKRVDHFALTVSDLERSLRFYRDLLGLEVRVRRIWNEDYVRRMVGFPDASMDIALLALPGDDDQQLELNEYLQPRAGAPRNPINTPGSAHLCFIVDDIQELYELLRQAGTEFVSEPVAVPVGPNKGRRTAYLLDPDGIVVQLMQPSKEE
jgi:catechol 2,3-dioxygenase-like lactoylglutathione lyase family enzyme